MSLLDELEEENKKSGLFSSKIVNVSYMTGNPVLDQQLGAIYRMHQPDGTIKEDVQIGVPAGTITMILGETSTGKTTFAEQMAWTIVEPFGDDAVVIHKDAEKAATYERVAAVTGADIEDIQKRYRIIQDGNTWEEVLQIAVEVAKKKEEDKSRYMYDTGKVDFYGNPLTYYIPTVILMDSLMKFTSANEDIDSISGLTSASREAIYRGKFFRNVLEYTKKYNINILVVHHTSDEMPALPGSPRKGKQMTFIPTGKTITGGDKVKLYTTSMILLQPINSKDEIKTEDENGYNGLPMKALVVKSRSSKGGTVAILEFIQEAGYDMRLTLLNFAKSKGLIGGRNPRSYIIPYNDVTFDTRSFMTELANNPEIYRTLVKACKPELDKLIPVMDTDDEGNPVLSKKVKQDCRNMMRELYS